MDDLPQQKDANNNSGGEENDDHAKQVEPSHGDNGVQSILSDDIFRLLASVAIVSWMIHEFVFDAHKIFLFIAIIFGLAEAFYVLAHKILKVGIIFCWLVYAVCLLAILKNEERPELKPYPYFTFSFRTKESPDLRIPLTQEFLKGGTNENSFVDSALFLPVEAPQSKVVVTFSVSNASPVLAEHLFITFCLPDDWPCIFGEGWKPNLDGYSDTNEEIGKKTHMVGWTCGEMTLFPGDETHLPPILMPATEQTNSPVVAIFGKSKDSKPDFLQFMVFFPPKEILTNEAPFVMKLPETNGGMLIDIRRFLIPKFRQ